MAESHPAAAASATGPEWEYELREPDGRLAGLVHVHQLVERLYLGTIDSSWQLRRPPPGPAWPGDPDAAGPWQPLWEVPALAAVYDLLDLRRSERGAELRISRWQRSEAMEEDDDSLQPSVSQTLPALPAAGPAPGHERPALLPILIGSVVLIVLLLIVGLVLSL